jgi:molybdopterin-containing oxidoreductase family membrane subunit
MAEVKYRRLGGHSPMLTGVMALHAFLVAAGLAAALYMESNGHQVTGMNNQIVWGLPHVFAVFLVVSASGALNVASVSSVFHRLAYKPFARLSGVLAVALLVGGLAILVLDLGRPDRVFVTLFHRNLKSIFAWNIYLYGGFFLIVAAYLFSMMDRVVSRKPLVNTAIAWTAFSWRLILTTGTGSIFGFLVARAAVSGGIMAPLFISASLVYGLAFTVLVVMTMCFETREALFTDEMVEKFRGLLFLFAMATLFLTAILHVSKLYEARSLGAELFLLRDGGVFPLLFWGGQVLLGTLAPLGLLALMRGGKGDRGKLGLASLLFLAGGMAQMYVVIIGAQAWPLDIFPGYDASSSFGDGAIATYVPTLPEAALGLAGVSLAMMLTALAFRLLPFLPQGVVKEASA